MLLGWKCWKCWTRLCPGRSHLLREWVVSVLVRRVMPVIVEYLTRAVPTSVTGRGRGRKIQVFKGRICAERTVCLSG
jgi:hypothetical protein